MVTLPMRRRPTNNSLVSEPSKLPGTSQCLPIRQSVLQALLLHPTARRPCCPDLRRLMDVSLLPKQAMAAPKLEHSPMIRHELQSLLTYKAVALRSPVPPSPLRKIVLTGTELDKQCPAEMAALAAQSLAFAQRRDRPASLNDRSPQGRHLEPCLTATSTSFAIMTTAA